MAKNCDKTVRQLEKLLTEAQGRLEDIQECLDTGASATAKLSAELTEVQREHKALLKEHSKLQIDADELGDRYEESEKSLTAAVAKIDRYEDSIAAFEETVKRMESSSKTLIQERDSYKERYLELRTKLGLVAEEVKSERLVHARLVK